MADLLLRLAHLLAVLVWVGGMAFVVFFLRPALAELAPPERLRLMAAVLRRFLAAVLVAVIVVLVSGALMMARLGGPPPWPWSAMAALGLVMALVFAFIRVRLFPPMQRAVQAQVWPQAAAALGRIRLWVTVNLVLGLLTVVLARL